MSGAIILIYQTIFSKGFKMAKTLVTAASSVCFFLLLYGAFSAQADPGTGAPGMRDAPQRRGDTASLTEQQVAAVKAILSKYSPASLSAADAKAIHRALRDAGLRAGPGLNQAVSAAGFDSDRLRDLDPPPDRKENADSGNTIGPGRNASEQKAKGR
jgi:hypothetical protein